MKGPLRSSDPRTTNSTPLQEKVWNLATDQRTPRMHREDLKENMPTPVKKIMFPPRSTQLTPLISKTQETLISKMNSDGNISEKAVSPGLTKLRMTPGPTLQEKQKRLNEKHQKAKESLDKLAVGGGVSLWPEMDRMRLTIDEGLILFLFCLLTCSAVYLVFKYLHGPLLLSLHHYTFKVRSFFARHSVIRTSQPALNDSVMRWHKEFWKLLDNIQTQFETHLHQAHATYILYLILYVCAVCTLLYYLADNMIQKSKLTPRRIKIWVLLLVATASWTGLMLQLLIFSQNLERAVEATVRRFLEELAELAVLDFDLEKYHNVATYWKIRCLPPTTQGTLSIFGIVPIKDVSFYLQYYSVPVLTALCTPVLRLILAMKEMYMGPCLNKLK